MKVNVFICIYLTPPTRTRCDTRSIFKQIKAGLNLEFSFSKTGYLNKLGKPSVSNYLPKAAGADMGSCLSQVH